MLPLENWPCQAWQATSTHPLLAPIVKTSILPMLGLMLVKNENKPEFSGRFFLNGFGEPRPFTGFSVCQQPFLCLAQKHTRTKWKWHRQMWQCNKKQWIWSTGAQYPKLQMQQEWKKPQHVILLRKHRIKTGEWNYQRPASLAYRAGEISFAELSQFLTQAIEIQKSYLENLNGYNQSVIQYNYYINQ